MPRQAQLASADRLVSPLIALMLWGVAIGHADASQSRIWLICEDVSSPTSPSKSDAVH